jgi:hypothetical protein
MLLTLLAVAAQAVFPGGSANDLTAHLAESTKQNVVFAASTLDTIGTVSYDPQDLKDISRKLRMRKIQIAAGVNLILNDGMILPARVTDEPEYCRQPDWLQMSTRNIQDGKVTLATKGKDRLDPMSLAKVPFSKPVKVHWFYEGLPVAVNVREMPEADFLKYMAKAVGAKLFIGAKEYRLDFDPDEVRKRTINLLSSWMANREFVVYWQETEEIDRIWQPKPEERIQMLLEAINEMPLTTFAQAFTATEGVGVFAPPGRGKTVRTFVETVLTTCLTYQYGDRHDAVRTPLGYLPLESFQDGTIRYELHLSSQFTLKLLFKPREGRDIGWGSTYPRIRKDR